MPAKKDITIRFCLDKGEGEDIKRSKFSEEEILDIRKCLSLEFSYCPWGQPGAKITSVQIIHDGITPVEDYIEGFFINRKGRYPLDGYPTPVVRFLLDRAMDEEEFRQCIFETSYCVRTKLMAKNDEAPYFAEDHNGYSSVLSRKQREQMIIILQCNKAYCGKQFSYPDGMPECGHSIPAMEFALKPTRRIQTVSEYLGEDSFRLVGCMV
jgi:hypothetical protein